MGRGAQDEGGPAVGWSPADVYAGVFAATTNAYMLVDADFVVVDANPAWQRAVGRSSAEIVGQRLFDLFPNDPSRPGPDFVGQLEASIGGVFATGQPDVLIAFRYDVAGVGGTFETRYWNVTNTAVTADTGRVELVVNFVEDVTALVAERRASGAVEASNQLLSDRVADAQADLLDRAKQLQDLNDRLRSSSARDRTVARALQDAMLTRLPEPVGVELAARYLTASDHELVGGDWYDAVVLPSGATTLTIGDVVGHDIDAAAIMGQLRNLLRALAWSCPGSPAAVVSQLDRAIEDLAIPAMATLLTATIQPPVPGRPAATRTVQWTNAGHPCPVVLTADGSAQMLDGSSVDLMIGVDAETKRGDHIMSLGPGATLLLYTDGLVETRHESLDGRQGHLLGVVERYGTLPPGQMIDAVIADMVGVHPTDDVAVLVARFDP